MTHTPGPWTFSGPYHYSGDLHPSYRIDAPDRLVASVFCHGDGESDARLITAGPELLAALVELMRIREWCIQAGGDKAPLPQDVIRQFALMQIPAVDAAYAAIAKATGATPADQGRGR